MEGSSSLTCVSDDDDEVGGDLVGADERDLVVVRVGHGELPLEDVEEAHGAAHLRLERAEVGRRLLEVRVLQQELVHVARRLLDRDAVDEQDHRAGRSCEKSMRGEKSESNYVVMVVGINKVIP